MRVVILINFLISFALALNNSQNLLNIYNSYPKSYLLNIKLGRYFYLQKNYMEAKKYYSRALIIRPKSLEAKLALMEFYLTLNSLNEAIKIGNAVIKRDYYNYYANYYLIKALILKRDFKSAQDLVNKMLSIYPSNTLFLKELVKIYKNINYQKYKTLKRTIKFINNIDKNILPTVREE